ncbi:putative tetratricopeptide-like helical domain-containing protein [Medicago truncatula]|uniref:Putative tetratricopeptide-like helical domain-containing protein n=1 Tax=Medicago truncatula TaxID=3880 RepID=A0A396JML6_MEDTR|nr:putative tetratricopeptide-like helical domain-containing protein [Medicago truncatula]
MNSPLIRTLSNTTQQLQQLLSQCTTLTHLQQTHTFILKHALFQNDINLSRFIHKTASLNYPSYSYSIFTFNHNRPFPIFVYNNIIYALYSSNAKLAVSIFRSVRRLGLSKLFDEFGGNGCVLNAMIVAYVKVGDVSNARKLFDSMLERDKDVFSWTAMISGYTQAHNPNEAIKLFRRMQLENVKPDEIAILAVLSACADLGALHLGEWIHNYIEKHKLSKIVPLYNSLIDMYAKSGNIRKALELFENMKHKTIITWTTMIAGLALHGLGKEALRVFSCMEKEDRVKPNEVTFIAILSACSHVGLVELGRDYFTSMRSRYGIEPKIEHYGCMIDLLGRAGHLQEAKEMVLRMPFEANAAIWGSLLAASTRCGDAELAEEALRHLTVLEPGHCGNYSLLSNTYASLGRWNESRMVRKVMQDAGVEKVPGVSFIEVNNIVYEFIAGDKLSIYFVDIYDVLHSLDGQIKIEIH